MSQFSELYPPVRTLLGDFSAVAPSWSNAQLDMGIQNALLQEEGFFVGEPDESGQTITPDLEEKSDIYRVSLRTAIALLSPSSGAFSWRTRSFGATRENGRAGHLGYLESELRRITDGDFAAASETEWDQWLRGTSAAVAKLGSFPG